MPNYCANPTTSAELKAAACTDLFRSVLPQPFAASPPVLGSTATACHAPVIDVFMTTLDDDFILDPPVLRALLPTLIAADPEGAVAVIAVAANPPDNLTPDQADEWLQKWLKAFTEATVGGGNIAGNITSTVEAALREQWRKQAAIGFSKLVAGDVDGVVRLGKHIQVTTVRIGKRGKLRPGAKIVVRVRGLPVKVVQSLQAPFIPKAHGSWAGMRFHPHDLQRLEKATVSIADARVRANAALRFAGKGGGAALAFGPSAAIDFYDAYTTNTGSGAVSKDFLVRSAKSQSGNALGLALGVGAVVVIGVTGAPAVVLALGVGIVVQSVWGATGGDVATSELVKGWLK